MPDSFGWMRPLLAILWLFIIYWLFGCAEHKHAKTGINLLVGPECLTKPVELLHCNTADPPKCEQVKVDYRKGCETLEIRK